MLQVYSNKQESFVIRVTVNSNLKMLVGMETLYRKN